MKVSQRYADSIRQPITSKMRDRTGQRIGQLIYLYPTTERIASGPVKWIARCDCGNLSLTAPSKLVSSCGCLKANGTTAATAARRKLSDAEVIAVRNSLMRCKDAAAVFGVSAKVISAIRSGRSCANVK